jgi:hypothetical protein
VHIVEMWAVNATDESKEALLLVGGDKKGKNEKHFYKKLIQSAEILIERYRP